MRRSITKKNTAQKEIWRGKPTNGGERKLDKESDYHPTIIERGKFMTPPNSHVPDGQGRTIPPPLRIIYLRGRDRGVIWLYRKGSEVGDIGKPPDVGFAKKSTH